MKKLFFSAAALALCATTASAKVWRINNNTGASADFQNPSNALAAASVASGDTLHLEPSTTAYAMPNSVSKSLVYIGPGYLLSGANGNAGLQADGRGATIGYFSIATGGAGSRFIGLTFNAAFGSAIASPNITFEKCRMENNHFYYLSSGSFSNITFRKCFFNNTLEQAGASFTNLTVENCIFSLDNGGFPSGSLQLNAGSGTGCVFRNNVVKAYFGASVINMYVANNIFITGTTTANNTFTGSNVKNNLFTSTTQTFPVGATANQTGVVESALFAGTGSGDARYMLKAGSPAVGAGATVGSVVTPDAGAYGGPDPYKISGIPSIPTIYSISVPSSIPQGQATMNVSFSTRSNN